MFLGFGNSKKDKKKTEEQQQEEEQYDPKVIINLLVKFAVLAVIGYAFIEYISEDGEQKALLAMKAAKQNQEEKINAEEEKRCFCLPPQKKYFFGSILPAIETHLGYEELSAGAGQKAVCGQDIKVDVNPVDSGLFGSGAKSPLLFRAGAGNIMRGLELGVLNMKVGGESRLYVPPEYTRANNNVAADKNGKEYDKTAELEVKLLHAAPPVPRSPMPMRVFMNAMGQGVQAKCGMRVALQMDLWSPQNELLFSTRIGDNPAGLMTATIGMGQLPFAMEQMLLMMRPGGEWTSIMPVELMQRFNPPQDEDSIAQFPPLLEDVDIPQSGVVVVDMVLVEIMGYDPLAEATGVIPALLFGGAKPAAVENKQSPVIGEGDNHTATHDTTGTTNNTNNASTTNNINKEEPANESAR